MVTWSLKASDTTIAAASAHAGCANAPTRIGS
jgi:hypothetical protein